MLQNTKKFSYVARCNEKHHKDFEQIIQEVAGKIREGAILTREEARRWVISRAGEK